MGRLGTLAGVAFSCVSRVAPVVPSARGRYEIHHLKAHLSTWYHGDDFL